jgi:hypothetical protein
MNKDIQSIIQWHRGLFKIYPSLLNKPLTKLSTYKLNYILSCINDEIDVYFYNGDYFNSKEDKLLYTNAKRYKKQIEKIINNRINNP